MGDQGFEAEKPFKDSGIMDEADPHSHGRIILFLQAFCLLSQD